MAPKKKNLGFPFPSNIDGKKVIIKWKETTVLQYIEDKTMLDKQLQPEQFLQPILRLQKNYQWEAQKYNQLVTVDGIWNSTII